MSPIITGVAGFAIGFSIQKAYRTYRSIKMARHIESLSKAKGLILRPGWAHNPALKYPPNYPCFCGSGAKFKKCCLSKLPSYVKDSQIPAIKLEVDNCVRLVETMGVGK